MPYLNWREAPVQSEVLHTDEGRTTLKLSITPELQGALITALIPTLKEDAGELRLNLPKNWTFFWKVRDDESRLLIAHPEKDEWVATFALESQHAETFLRALQGLAPSQSLVLSSFGTCGSVSNTDLTLEIKT